MEPERTYKELLIENKEMEKELEQSNYNRKVNNVTTSAIYMIIMQMILAILTVFALSGANNAIEKLNWSFATITLLQIFFAWGPPLLGLYLVWHWLTVIYYNYTEEILAGVKKCTKWFKTQNIKRAKQIIKEAEETEFNPPA